MSTASESEGSAAGAGGPVASRRRPGHGAVAGSAARVSHWAPGPATQDDTCHGLPLLVLCNKQVDTAQSGWGGVGWGGGGGGGCMAVPVRVG
jgi:hypothetical protein